MDDSIQVCVLKSGSRGNSTLIRCANTSLLIDAGISGAALEETLAKLTLTPGHISHVLITHEHADHISGLASVLKRCPAVLHINRGTYLHVGSLVQTTTPVNIFDSAFEIGDIKINPFAVSHDAVDPVGFMITIRGKSICIATDMGMVTQSALDFLRRSDLLILESNHDERMLMLGSYPGHLKRRIAGSRGHLSNRQAAACLQAVVHSDRQQIILAHLSEENNRPELARASVEKQLSGFFSPQIHVAAQESGSSVIEL